MKFLGAILITFFATSAFAEDFEVIINSVTLQPSEPHAYILTSLDAHTHVLNCAADGHKMIFFANEEDSRREVPLSTSYCEKYESMILAMNAKTPVVFKVSDRHENVHARTLYTINNFIRLENEHPAFSFSSTDEGQHLLSCYNSLLTLDMYTTFESERKTIPVTAEVCHDLQEGLKFANALRPAIMSIDENDVPALESASDLPTFLNPQQL